MKQIKELIKNGFNFVRKNPAILSSLILLVLIPLALYLNTRLAIQSFQKALDRSVTSTAFIAERIFDAFSTEMISSPQNLQQKIEEIFEKSPEDIIQIKVEVLKQDKFETIASYPQENKTNEFQSPETKAYFETMRKLAWERQEKEIGFSSFGMNGETFRNVIRTLYSQSGEKTGIVEMTMSLKEIDGYVNNTLRQLYIILIIAIALTVLLIINHTKLFGYSVLYKKIQELDKMKDDFISMTAHELRTPIAAIRGYAEILKEKIGQSIKPEESEHLSRVIISANRLSNLIDDILDVSRIEQGRLPIEMQKISPIKIINEVIDELKVKADEKNLQLLFAQNQIEEQYLISADPQRLKQILVNLIGNSIKYTKKGKIEIETIANDIKEKYSISIKDTGVGISAEAQKRLFEKFYKIVTKETSGIMGSGLGLWITKALTEKMNGQIFIESMEGIGSKFTLVFPLAKK